MGTFGRINFWIVLFCVCSAAKALPVGSLRDSNIDWMRDTVTCEQDSKFYTPTNIKPECITAALRCFQAELQTVSDECQDPDETIAQARGFLGLQQKRGELNATVCPCESWSEESFPDFLDAMQSLLERIFVKASQDQRRTT